jgi:hypothetical protein
MEIFEKAVEIEVPVRTAYNQFTQFEDFPQFNVGTPEEPLPGCNAR